MLIDLLFLLFFLPHIISILILIICFLKIKNENFNLTKLDKLGETLNKLSAIFFIVMSPGFLLAGGMSATMAMGVDNQMYINMVNIFVYTSIYLPAIAFICIALSVILRRKNKHVWSFMIQFLPIILLLTCFFLLSIIPK